MTACTKNPFQPGNASPTLEAVERSESARKAILRLALAGKCRLDIGVEVKLPLHKVSKHLSRLKLDGKLDIEVPVTRSGPPRRGEALKKALSEARRAPAASVRRDAPRPKVTASDETLIAEFLSRKAPTKCPTRYAEGASPEAEQFYRFRLASVAA